MELAIQIAVIVGGIALVFLLFGMLCVFAGWLLEKIFTLIYSVKTKSVSPFSLSRIFLIGIFDALMVFLKMKDVENVPLFVLIAVVLNCLILFAMEKNRKRYGLRNLILGILIFAVAPILAVLIVAMAPLAGFSSSNSSSRSTGNSTYTQTGYNEPDPAAQFQEKFDPVIGKYYEDGYGNMKDANQQDVNPWDKPYWMP